MDETDLFGVLWRQTPDWGTWLAEGTRLLFLGGQFECDCMFEVF